VLLPLLLVEEMERRLEWGLLELDRSGRSCYRCGFLQVWPAVVDGGDEVADYVVAVAWRESGWKKREGMMVKGRGLGRVCVLV
jgi:hypothetical protein